MVATLIPLTSGKWVAAIFYTFRPAARVAILRGERLAIERLILNEQEKVVIKPFSWCRNKLFQ